MHLRQCLNLLKHLACCITSHRPPLSIPCRPGSLPSQPLIAQENDELRMVKYLHVHEVREVIAQEKGGGRALILMVPPAELAEYHTVRCGA